jgi:hypothetical protein
MAVAIPRPRALLGRVAPMFAPPVPARSRIRDYTAAAKELGIELMPHQRLAARYLQAIRPDGLWQYREVALVMSRQNGKTEELLPLIRARLKMGRRILHTAQNRTLPREVFVRLAQEYAGRPETVEIRLANGQEVLRLRNGARYTLVAPKVGKAPARGYSIDDVILDELREAQDFELIGAIRPTMTASANPQTIYLSNAGSGESVVLNDLRRRGLGQLSPRLAYLEWSAGKDRADGDRAGWAEANPALGRTILLETLEDYFDSLPRAVFETEHLCRWVPSMQPKFVNAAQFEACRVELPARPSLPAMAVSLDAAGTRAAAALAWRQSSGKIALREVASVTGEPIDDIALGRDLRPVSLRAGVTAVGFDDLTDRALAQEIDGRAKRKRARAITGREFANACELFVRLVESGRLAWDVGDDIAGDLAWAARKATGEEGAWIAVKADVDRPIPALLAAIRAVWLASSPASGRPRTR